MTELSVFADKSVEPTTPDLEKALDPYYPLWQKIVDLTYEAYPEGKEEWNYPGKKYGWSFRIKDKRRAIIYLLPYAGYFKAAFVFGDKALDEILSSQISESIKADLLAARKYAEGRGVSFEVRSATVIPDIETLIRIKLKY